MKTFHLSPTFVQLQLIHRKNRSFPNLVISNVEVDSDDENAYLLFEERAENYYQCQLEEEFQHESGMESA